MQPGTENRAAVSERPSQVHLAVALAPASARHHASRMRTMQRDISTGRLADTGQLAVARTMPVPVTAAIAAACDDDVMAAVGPLDALWQRDRTGPFGRSDLAAARTRGTLTVGRRRAPVDIELAPWSNGATEIVLRPAGGRRTAGADAGGSAGTTSRTPRRRARHEILGHQPSAVRRRWFVAVDGPRRGSRDRQFARAWAVQRRPSPPGRTALGGSASLPLRGPLGPLAVAGVIQPHSRNTRSAASRRPSVTLAPATTNAVALSASGPRRA